MEKSKILLIEDEADIRQLMQMHLTREGYEVTAVEDGEKGLKFFNENKYNLAILDWMLPSISGLELCKKFKGIVPILMVTARADAADVVLGLEVGADDYITKPFELPIFIARVKALLRRAAILSNGSALERYSLGEVRVDVGSHQAWVKDQEIKLTLSEFKLLVALLDNKGRVLSRDKLIEHVQGPDVNVTDRTVDTHIFGLRKKLGLASELIETIRGIGYRVKAE